MKYFDEENARSDVKKLHEILRRQGTGFYIEVLAEYVALTAQRFKLHKVDVDNCVESIVEEFKEQINERT